MTEPGDGQRYDASRSGPLAVPVVCNNRPDKLFLKSPARPVSVIVAAEQPANNWWPAVIFGSGLVVLGVGMMIAHWRSWKRQQLDAETSNTDQLHYANRFRRRMQTSALIAIVGLLLGLGDVFIWRFGVPAATLFWMVMLILVSWIAVLAVGDMTAIQSYSKNQLADLETQRRVLEKELAEIRARNGTPTNGERRNNGDQRH